MSLFYLARFMGTSVEQIDRTYGHLLPDAMSTFAAYSTPGTRKIKRSGR